MASAWAGDDGVHDTIDRRTSGSASAAASSAGDPQRSRSSA